MDELVGEHGGTLEVEEAEDNHVEALEDEGEVEHREQDEGRPHVRRRGAGHARQLDPDLRPRAPPGKEGEAGGRKANGGRRGKPRGTGEEGGW